MPENLPENLPKNAPKNLPGKIIAHRGGAAYAPENSFSAFRWCVRHHVDWIEMDVTLSRDHVALLWHDETVARCSNGKGRVADYSFAALQRLDAGSWFSPVFAGEKMFSVEQLLYAARQKQIGLNLEMKIHEKRQNHLPQILADLCKIPAFRENRLVVSCFDEEALAKFATLCPQIPTGLLYTKLPADWQKAAKRCNSFTVHLDYRYVTAQRISDLRRSGLYVYCYTVNDPPTIAPLWSAGLCGVISDDPLVFFRDFAARGIAARQS